MYKVAGYGNRRHYTPSVSFGREKQNLSVRLMERLKVELTKDELLCLLTQFTQHRDKNNIQLD